MSYSATAHDYESWRKAARLFLQGGISPEELVWQRQDQHTLFGDMPVLPPQVKSFHVSADFLQLAKTVSCHRAPERFDLLYMMLWQLTYENKHALHILSDPIPRALRMMEKSVRRDVHKTKAFVRFRKIGEEENERFIAWHCPDHYSLPLSAPFFQRRFESMRWSILTPDACADWDGQALRFGPGANKGDAPAEDAMEELWKNFYSAIFNPARLNVKAMKREMPVRHWKTLPEASLIPKLLEEAPERIQRMIDTQEGFAASAADFIPVDGNLSTLAQAAKDCRGCPLYKQAHQTVFGEGPPNARIMLVGEQPGNEEDTSGRPFVGPAGQVLNKALAETGLKREEIYITNAVKHFKFTQQKKHRHHRTPDLKEITGCKPWLERELSLVKPEIVICLGVSAARSLISPGFTLKIGRGEFFPRGKTRILATYHPSAVLRAPEPEQVYANIISDFKKAVVSLG